MKHMIQSVTLGLTVGILSLARPVTAYAENKDPYDGLRAVVVYHSMGEGLSQETRNEIIKTFVKSMNYGLLKASADDIYGRAPSEFPKRTAKTGPISSFLKTLDYASKYVDMHYGSTLSPKIRQDSKPGNWTFTIETFLVPYELGDIPTAESKLVPPNLAMMWDVSKASFQEKLTADQAAVMDGVTTTPVIAASEFPGGIGKAYAAGAQVLKKLNNDENLFKFLPIYFRFLVQVSNNKLTVQTNTVIKPGEINMADDALLNPDPNAPFHIEKIWSRPFGQTYDPAMQVKVQRSWGTDADYASPLAIISWGTLAPNDVRDVKKCEKDCQNYRTAHPNIMIKLTPAKLLKAKETDGRVKKVINSLASYLDKKQQNMITMHVLFNQLVLDISKLGKPTLTSMMYQRVKELGLKAIKELPSEEQNAIAQKYRTDNNAVMANLTDTPIVIQFRSAPSDMGALNAIAGQTATGAIRNYYYVIGRESHQNDPDQAFRNNPDLVDAYWITRNKARIYNAAVIKLYESMVGPMLAEQIDINMKPDLQLAIKNADIQSGQQVVNMLEPVLDLFR